MTIPVLPSNRKLRRMARKMDAKNPELRKLYAKQKASNEALDQEVNELTDEMKDLLNHDKETPDEK